MHILVSAMILLPRSSMLLFHSVRVPTGEIRGTHRARRQPQFTYGSRIDAGALDEVAARLASEGPDTDALGSLSLRFVVSTMGRSLSVRREAEQTRAAPVVSNGTHVRSPDPARPCCRTECDPVPRNGVAAQPNRRGRGDDPHEDIHHGQADPEGNLIVPGDD